MKKFLTLAAFALLFAACGPKDNGICVDKFYENPTAHLGKDVTITGHAKRCCCTGDLMLAGCNKQVIRIALAEGVVAPEINDTTFLKVKGIVSETVIDEQFIATLREKANATPDSTERVKQLAKVDAIKVGDRNYTINATAIEQITVCCKSTGKEGCAKEGQQAAKEGCCTKKCEGKQTAEGCVKKCEGQQTAANNEGCTKKCEGAAKVESK